MKQVVNVESKKAHGQRIYEANKSHNDRKKKGLRAPKNNPYKKPKYRVSAYDYDEDEY